jgi:hypothetical protein
MAMSLSFQENCEHVRQIRGTPDEDNAGALSIDPASIGCAIET